MFQKTVTTGNLTPLQSIAGKVPRNLSEGAGDADRIPN
jgi:hypothetical protein